MSQYSGKVSTTTSQGDGATRWSFPKLTHVCHKQITNDVDDWVQL